VHPSRIAQEWLMMVPLGSLSVGSFFVPVYPRRRLAASGPGAFEIDRTVAALALLRFAELGLRHSD
jgi:hypothetical protein